MDLKLKGKTAIVTAGGSGIGKLMSTALIQEGCNVVIASRNIESLKSVAVELNAVGGGKAFAVQADISVEEDVVNMVKAAVATFGKIDVLVNNTGVPGPISDLVEMNTQEWNDALAVDLTGTMMVTREVLKVMIPQGSGGSIINIGAEAMRIADGWGGFPRRSSYMACKAGIQAMQAAVSVEVGKHKIRVNMISPAMVKSDRGNRIGLKMTNTISLEELCEIEKVKYSLKRITEPEDVAQLVVFLASDASIAITNQTIACTSGLSLMAPMVK